MYLILVIGELIDKLYNAQLFLKMDFRLGYHQIRVKKEDLHKTTLCTYEGHYKL